ncbi:MULTISPECIES: cytochrome C assembly family protein [Bacillales]|uniref:cytochrome C assembly family protein n=1 Tax=Bacillales TaxID=1385 RepID=UPI000BF3348A|nr:MULTISPECIES: cytochrome c biogenesis protein CcsA [Bacillaceae]PFG14119.1 HemX protein [Bacillus sp. es.036]QHA92774.1 cytochrome C assembly protein [Bacillus sp. N1-1]
MTNASWLYDITILLYALSVLGYFIDFLQNSRKVNQFAFWLLSIVWVLQSAFLVTQIIEIGGFPILTPFEGLFFYAWVIVSLSLLINWFFRVDFFVFFANVLGFSIMAINLFATREQASSLLTEQLMSELSIIHITMAFLSYGAFSLSFIFSIMYLILYQMLKRKKWNKRLRRFGDLSQLEKLSYLCSVLGVPLLLLSLILGIVWAILKVDQFSLFDAKVIISFFVLGAYSTYLYQKVAREMEGRSLALWNVAAFLIVLINVFLSGTLSEFHFWYV